MRGGGGGWNGGGKFDSYRFAPVDKEGWHLVRSKQERWGGGQRGTRSVDIASGSRRPGGGKIISFYFTSFPERWRARDMLEIFNKQDRVQEVVISARRNASGRRFGFVRFFDVKDLARLVVILDNIFVEGEKIHVNLPRFQREVKQDQQPAAHCPKAHTQVWRKKTNPCTILKGSTMKEGANAEGQWVCDIDVEPHLPLAMVGEVIISGKSYYIQDKLAQEGVFAIKATPMGSNLVLLEGDKEDDDFKEYIRRPVNGFINGSSG